MASNRPYLATALGLVVLLFVGAAHAVPANVSLAENANKNGTIEVAVVLDQADATRRPILAEVFVEFDAKRMAFLAGAAGETAKNAGKSLFVHEVSKGVIRFTLSGVNLRPLPNGEIAVLKFSAISTGSARVALDSRRTRFAPRRAREGLSFDHPIIIQIAK